MIQSEKILLEGITKIIKKIYQMNVTKWFEELSSRPLYLTKFQKLPMTKTCYIKLQSVIDIVVSVRLLLPRSKTWKLV